MKRLYLALALLATLPCAAHAQETHVSAHARYSDLDLATPDGVRTFDRRLKWAIRVVCAELNGNGDLSRRFAYERCVTAKTSEMAPRRDRVVAAHGDPILLADRQN